jgi:hypothetical protein
MGGNVADVFIRMLKVYFDQNLYNLETSGTLEESVVEKPT